MLWCSLLNTQLPNKLHQSTECYPGLLKMPATETDETLGRTTFRTRPKSPKKPQQPIFFLQNFENGFKHESLSVCACLTFASGKQVYLFDQRLCWGKRSGHVSGSCKKRWLSFSVLKRIVCLQLLVS